MPFVGDNCWTDSPEGRIYKVCLNFLFKVPCLAFSWRDLSTLGLLCPLLRNLREPWLPGYQGWRAVSRLFLGMGNGACAGCISSDNLAKLWCLEVWWNASLDLSMCLDSKYQLTLKIVLNNEWASFILWKNLKNKICTLGTEDCHMQILSRFQT